ncbi:MAG: pilus assembly protein TadG-related protein [Ornithinimicrobium sp.]|uniref:pilus assembly protein TadG-related protein n=1 Tax=Ornithinimicrobium sp. TaxID=1977084 RepID=UPI003D9B7115
MLPRRDHGRSGEAAGRPRSNEDGQIGVLLIGMVGICLTLIMGIVGVTSVQLSRIQLLDAADAAALDAADAVSPDTVYGEGVGAGVPLTDAGVIEAATSHLAAREAPPQVSDWRLVGDSGTPDGRTAVVQLRAQVRIPVVSQALQQFGGSVGVTVRSTARSELE